MKIVITFLLIQQVFGGFSVNDLHQEIENLDLDANFDTICDRMCICHESTKYNSIPMWVVDCSVRGLTDFQLNNTIPSMIVGLDVSRNKIGILEGSPELFQSVTLQWLDVSRNKIHTITDNYFKYLGQLVKLDISENILTTLPLGIFNGLAMLQELDLSFNRFQTLPTNIFHELHHLKILSLSYNPLGDYLLQNFTKKSTLTKSLRILRIENTTLTKFTESLSRDLSNLTELYLSENPLHDLSPMPSGLQVLDLSGTKITNLNSHILNCPQLKVLRVNRAYNLTNIDEYAFYYLEQIEVLSLQDCIALTSFPDLSFGYEKISETFPDHTLRILSLERSGLSGLNQSLVHFFNRTSVVALDGNPWNCNCNLEWIRQLNLDLDSPYLRCEQPAILHSIPFKNSTRQLCHYNKSISMTTLVFVCLFFTILILATLMLYKGPWGKDSKHIGNVGHIAPTSPYCPYDLVTINPNQAE